MTVKNPRPKEQFRAGSTFKTNNFGIIEVVDYRNCYDVLVKFEDGTLISASTTNIKNGEVRNPNKPTIYNRGFYGVGETLPTKSREYVMWINMFHRCYSGKYPSYEGVEVCIEWNNFQNFIKWLREQPNWDNKAFALDKDIKCEGNLLYSPNTCMIIPKQFNCLFTTYGQTKKFKELPTGVTYSSCGKYFQVQWSDDKHRCKYFSSPKEARDYWLLLKKQKVQYLLEKYKNYLTDEVILSILNYDWTRL